MTEELVNASDYTIIALISTVLIVFVSGGMVLLRAMRTIAVLAGMNYRAMERERRDTFEHRERLQELEKAEHPEQIAGLHTQERVTRLDFEKTVDCESIERAPLRAPTTTMPPRDTSEQVAVDPDVQPWS